MTFTGRFRQLDAHDPQPIPRDPSDRRGYVGGSEIASVLNLDPYGCARRLWYLKTNTPPDREFRETGVMTVGKVMEDHIAALVSEKHGLQLRRRAPVVGMPHEGAHLDRHIVATDERGPGVLEIKCVGTETFRRWQFDGVAQGYVLQLQWYMYVTGWKWGILAAWNREHLGDGGLKLFHFAYDADLMQLVSERVDRFWHTVEQRTAPPILEARDHRCDGCQFGVTCREEEWANVGGEERRDDLVQLVDRYAEARELAKSAESLVDARRRELAAAVGDIETCFAGDWKVTAKVQTARRVDVEKLRAEWPEVYESCTAESISRPLRVVKKKG